ncbi:MAG: GAP family protein [Anaerolineales bacterium]|nr:GAP family protein [Anaerolineales bacterium]
MVNLLPLIIGAALLPVWIIMTLFLLRTEHGVRKALAFVVGAIAVRLVQGILFGYVFGASATAEGEEGSSLIVATLLLVVGILLLVSAFKSWRKEEDPDAPPPKWMARFDQLSTLHALGMGALLMAVSIKQWVFTLSAIAVIEEAQLMGAAAIATYLGFVLAAQSLMVAPIIFCMVAPTKSASALDTLQGWLERNNRTILLWVSLIFGLWSSWKGIAGLMGW